MSIEKELTRYGKRLVEQGLVAGPGGNMSVRDGSCVLLSPSGFFLDEIGEKDWVRVNLDTGKVSGKIRPTCEISMHMEIYRERADVNAVIHTHPPFTVGLISAGVSLKPVFPDYVMLLGRDIAVIDYLHPGCDELSRRVAVKARKSDVILLKNHGAVCLGETLKESFARSCILEETAKCMLAGYIAGKGEIDCLSPAQAEELENMEAENFRKAMLKKRKS